jgi:uncharacterized UBP type Zn finger protein
VIRCEHLGQVRQVQPSADGCEDCLRTGDGWLELRLCLECGHVGCCDSSMNRHARRHFQETHHPVMRAFGSEEEFAGCYAHRDYLDPQALEQALGPAPAART